MVKNQRHLPNKQDKHQKVAAQALAILVTFGPEKLSHSFLARKSGVSRSWLYKYIGKTRQSVLEFAIRDFGAFFSHQDRLSPVNRTEFIEVKIAGLKRLFDVTKDFPFALPLYFRFCGSSGYIGIQVSQVREAYLKRLEKEIQQCSISTSHERVVAEAVMETQLALALRWQTQRQSEDIEDKLLGIYKKWLEAL